MGKLERFERKQRIQKMKEAKAAERVVKQEKAQEALKACINGIKKYRDWSASRKTSKGRLLAFSAPVLVVLGLLGLGSMSSEPEAIEPEVSKAEVVEPEAVKAEVVEPTPVADAAEMGGEKVQVIKTGLDFQDVYEGERFEESDGTFRVVVEVDEGCPGSGRRDYEFTYSLETQILSETIIDIKNCSGQNGVYPWGSNPFEIESDGTIRVDSLEDDGTIIVDDYLVISGAN